MPSAFISYSHDPADPTHAERVAGLAASLLEGGLEVFFDQNRGDEEEGLPWEIWMEDKIEEADYVLLVCTELYLKKIRQKIGVDDGLGVCWEAAIIFALLYRMKRNTTKFLSVMFRDADKKFIPLPLQGKQYFVIDTQSGYELLYAFVTRQHRPRFARKGAAIQTIAQETIEPFFSLPGQAEGLILKDSASRPDELILATNSQLMLKPDDPPLPRQDIRGLDWYDECDARYFLGRDDDADRILPKLLSHPILRILGPSGIGKSSLIRAGLLPKIREFGWRACVIRPFEDPAQRVTPQFTAKLLAGTESFTTPLDPAKFRAEVSPLLSRKGISRLVLIFDQFEDIVSPMAASDAVDAMRGFLEELWQRKEAKPYLRAVVVYRTDADARLGRLWQEISGKSDGLPYYVLQGLSRSTCEQIINQTARDQGWHLETSVPKMVRQLGIESEKLDCSGEIFPVYLQIFLKQVQQSAERSITAGFIASLGDMSGLIGRYLEQTLASLRARGGEWEQCGAVMESLSRSSGAWPTQSLNDLVRETGVSRDILAEMLPVLINERLVRPVGHESYEIQHDRLAAAVIDSMKDSDREAKAAREFLAAKVPAFERTMIPMVPSELVYIYRHRRKIHPTERELQLLLASMLHEIGAQQRSEALGAYWLNGYLPQEILNRLIQTERWASTSQDSLRPSHAWAEKFPISGIESQFSALAADPCHSLRAICAAWIGRAKRPADLPLLLDLVRDSKVSVQLAAVKAAANFPSAYVLPLLRHIVMDDKYAYMHLAAFKALSSFFEAEDIPLLRERAKSADQDMRIEATTALAKVSYAKALPLLQDLAENRNVDVRVKTVKALTRLSYAEALPLLRRLAKDKEFQVRAEVGSVLENFSGAEALPLLHRLAEDADPRASVNAVKALATFSRTEDLPLLRHLANHWHLDMRVEAVKALASFSRTEDLPLLLQRAQDKEWRVRVEAVKALGKAKWPGTENVLRALAEDKDWHVRVEAVKALAGLSRKENLLLLCTLALASEGNIAAEAIRGLASICCPKELEVFLNQHDQVLCPQALAALDRSLYMPEWLKMKEKEEIRDPGETLSNLLFP